jgi:hypothetical protein
LMGLLLCHSSSRLYPWPWMNSLKSTLLLAETQIRMATSRNTWYRETTIFRSPLIQKMVLQLPTSNK